MKSVSFILVALVAIPTVIVAGSNSQVQAEECEACAGHVKGHAHKPHGGVMGMMPQTCYNPPYGCYPGAARHTHRYPAFHGTFYSKSYNYRNYFDYPVHAGLHEPTSHFSYHVEQETNSTGMQQPPAPIMNSEPAPVVPAAPQPTTRLQRNDSELETAATEQVNFAPVVKASDAVSHTPVVASKASGLPVRSLRR